MSSTVAGGHTGQRMRFSTLVSPSAVDQRWHPEGNVDS